jgi:hypothetical protein
VHLRVRNIASEGDRLITHALAQPWALSGGISAYVGALNEICWRRRGVSSTTRCRQTLPGVSLAIAAPARARPLSQPWLRGPAQNRHVRHCDCAELFVTAQLTLTFCRHPERTRACCSNCVHHLAIASGVSTSERETAIKYPVRQGLPTGLNHEQVTGVTYALQEGMSHSGALKDFTT